MNLSEKLFIDESLKNNILERVNKFTFKAEIEEFI